MAYVGNTPTTQSFISGTDYFNGTGSQTAFTLSRTVASVNDIQAVVNNVVQVPNDAYTISGTTITFTSAPSAGTQNVYVRYLSTTTQAITPSQNTVSWNTLDSNTQQDLGLMGKNKIINGAMVISQRNGTSATTVNGNDIYTIDRYKGWASGGGVFSVTQSTTAPSGFSNSALITVTTADSSIAAGDYYRFAQVIEGYNVADLNFGSANAKTVTLSFWVRSSITGTFGGSFYSSPASRSYVFNYTISSANTWTYITTTATGDTSGSWNNTNGQGMTVYFDLGSGSNYENATGSWVNGEKFRTSGNATLISTLNNTFYITGVQLEVGTQATAFSTAGGSYGAELALCQRYLPVFNSSSTFDLIGFGYTTGTTNAQMSFEYFVPPRVPPTGVTNTAASSFFFYYGPASYGVSAISFVAGSSRMATINCAISAPSGGLSGVLFTNSATAQLLFTGCEL